MEEINLLTVTKDISVLYVEDDEMLRQKNTILLKELFFDVEEASDGEIGLEMYKARLNDTPYDLIISDINMPNMNGIEMSQHIKELNSEQTILIFSAYNDSEYLMDLMEKGITHFTQKPLKLDDFKTKLTKACMEVINRKKEHALQTEYKEYVKEKEKNSDKKINKILNDILLSEDEINLD